MKDNRSRDEYPDGNDPTPQPIRKNADLAIKGAAGKRLTYRQPH